MQRKLLTFSEITGQTLVGYLEMGFPSKHGNCFSVAASDGRPYRIVNFFAENLEHLLETGILTYPMGLAVLAPGVAVVRDHRIPDDYYRDEFCTICCPYRLLPEPQKLRWDRAVKSGRIKLIKLIKDEKGRVVAISEQIEAKA